MSAGGPCDNPLLCRQSLNLSGSVMNLGLRQAHCTWGCIIVWQCVLSKEVCLIVASAVHFNELMKWADCRLHLPFLSFVLGTAYFGLAFSFWEVWTKRLGRRQGQRCLAYTKVWRNVSSIILAGPFPYSMFPQLVCVFTLLSTLASTSASALSLCIDIGLWHHIFLVHLFASVGSQV